MSRWLNGRWSHWKKVVATLGLIWLGGNASVFAQPFEAQTVDDHVQIGYGIVLEDVDGDGKRDIILADKRQFVWYRNPDWQRFVLVENLTPHDNVCVAARDLDGDGKAEIAVGANWNPGDTIDSGSVHYLVAPEDRTRPWTPISLPHEPTVHRMHWVKLAAGRYALVVAPLHGRGNRNGEGAGVKLLAYEMPADVTQPWRTTVIDDTMHMTHNLDPCQWYPATASEELLYIGREGALLLSFENDTWKREKLERVSGGGEIRLVQLAHHRAGVATIEPMHGDKLMLYLTNHELAGATRGEPFEFTGVVPLDATYNGGHAIVAGDFLGTGSQQVAAGWRLPNREGAVGVKLYVPGDSDSATWTASWIDRNGMATEDLRAADLNGDGALDLVAAGRATNNLKIYWNRRGK